MPRKRGHGEGSYYQTADGRWRGAISVRRPDGSTGRVYVSGRTKREAMAAAARRRAELATVSPAADRTVTVAAYLDQWLRDIAAPSVRPSTLVSYRAQLARVTRELGGYRLAELRHAHIQAAYRRIATGALTMRTMHGTLHNALARAVIWGLIPANPADGVALPRVERVRRPVLTPGQAAAFIEAAWDERLGSLWVLLLTSGLRYSEAVALCWQDIDFDAGTINIHRQLLPQPGGAYAFTALKTAGSERSEPLAVWAAAALRERRARQREERLAAATWADVHGLVFTSPAGGPLAHSTAGPAWHRFRAQLGLPAMRMHDLRHSYASLLAAAGVHPRVAADLMGHSSPTMTLGVYTHSTTEQRRGAIADLERRIGGSA